jgi:hypothetical protein
MLIVITAGLVAGIVHVLSGPDHLAAVAPLSASTGPGRWRAGLTWGIGHTGGVLVVGVLALLLRGVLPIDEISSWSERIVGLALVGVGVWTARLALRTRVHTHAHTHGTRPHVHVHVHRAAPDAHRPAPAPPVPHAHTHASFGFGILHGLAGSSHVLGIVPALALPTRSASVAYLLAYGAGNIAGMTAFSSAIGYAAARAEGLGTSLYRGLLATCSVVAIAVGVFWLAA